MEASSANILFNLQHYFIHLLDSLFLPHVEDGYYNYLQVHFPLKFLPFFLFLIFYFLFPSSFRFPYPSILSSFHPSSLFYFFLPLLPFLQLFFLFYSVKLIVINSDCRVEAVFTAVIAVLLALIFGGLGSTVYFHFQHNPILSVERLRITNKVRHEIEENIINNIFSFRCWLFF